MIQVAHFQWKNYCVVLLFAFVLSAFFSLTLSVCVFFSVQRFDNNNSSHSIRLMQANTVDSTNTHTHIDTVSLTLPLSISIMCTSLYQLFICDKGSIHSPLFSCNHVPFVTSYLNVFVHMPIFYPKFSINSDILINSMIMNHIRHERE